MSNNKILVINSGFPELNQLAAALADTGQLSTFVRPYANLGRTWERTLTHVPYLAGAYAHTFGRRRMPTPLGPHELSEAGIGWDFAMAIHHRLPFRSAAWRHLRSTLMRLRDNAVAQAGANRLANEAAVVASWGVARPAFEVARKRGIVRILNYSLAHHAFADRYLQQEAALEPQFAPTLNSYNLPKWKTDQLNDEIAMADHILVGSTFVRDTFMAEGVSEQKLCVIPYGADTAIFCPPQAPRPRDRFNTLFVGQLTQRKGLSYLLRAFERLHDASATLTLVGQMQDDGTALRPWQYLFRHIPHIPRSELATVFQQSDVFVFPTLVEGMPLVVLEAMASGIPVITTPNGPGDIVRDGVDGFVVPPRDEDALVHCLKRLRNSSALRETMGNSASARASTFTWRKYQSEVLSSLNQFIANNQPACLEMAQCAHEYR